MTCNTPTYERTREKEIEKDTENHISNHGRECEKKKYWNLHKTKYVHVCMPISTEMVLCSLSFSICLSLRFFPLLF